MSKVYTDNIEKRTGGAAIAVPASGQWIDLASAAQGDVLYHNGTSYVRLAAGTSGQVLQTQGAGANPVWAADAAGALVHLSTTTVSSVVTEIQVNDVFSATYTNYRIVFNNIVPDTDNNTIYLGFKETSVATQLNMHSITRNFGVTSAGATAYGDSSEYNMGGQELTKTASADGGLNGWIEVYVPFASGGSNWTRTTYAFMNYNPGDTSWSHTYGAGQATTNVSTPCFRVFSSGNIGDATITGHIRVYGYKDS